MLICLVKIAALDPTSGDRTDVFLSQVNTRAYGAAVNGLDDHIWEPALTRAPAIGISLFNGDFTTPVSAAQARFNVNLATVAKSMPGVEALAWMGAQVTIYVGKPGDAWPWGVAFAGRVQSYEAQGLELIVTAEVDTEPFDAPVLGSIYAGTGGLNGDADLANRVRPLVIGWARNVEPVLINAVDNVYQFSGYGPIQAVETLFERGMAFPEAVSDYSSYALLLAADIPPGKFATCLANGLVRLGAPAYGLITGDVKGHRVGISTPRLTGEVITALADLASVDPARLHSASLATLDGVKPRPASLVLAEQASFIDVARRLVLPQNCQAGISNTGLLFTALVTFAGSEAITLDAQGRSLPLVSASREMDVSPPYAKTTMGAARCWRVHTPDEIAVNAQLNPRGDFDIDATYREGDWVKTADGATWLYINAEPTAGNAPPDWPTASNEWWENLTPPSSGGISGVLTNEVHNVASETDGSGADFTGAGGEFKVFQGSQDVTELCAFAVLSEDGVDVTIDADSGVYVVNSMPTATFQGTAIFRATYGSLTLDKTYSIVKQPGGASAKLFFLISDAQQMKYDAAGAVVPGQTITFTGQRQNTTAPLVVRLYRVNSNGTQTQIDAGGMTAGLLTGSGTVTENLPDANSFQQTGLTITMTSAQFASAVGANLGVIVEVSCDGVVDKMSVIKSQDGAAGADALDVVLTKPSIPLPVDASSAVTSYSLATGNLVVRTPAGADVSSSFTLSVLSNPQNVTGPFTSSSIVSGQAYQITGGFDPGEASALVVLRATGSGAHAGKIYDRTLVLTKSAINTNVSNDRDSTPLVAPTMASDGSAYTFTTNNDGSINLKINWSWVGAIADIDGFEVIFVQQSNNGVYALNTSPSVEVLFYTGPDRTWYRVDGIPADAWYTVFVRAYRIVDKDINANGIMRSSAVKSAASGQNPFRPLSVPNYIGNVGGVAATAIATVKANFDNRNDRNPLTPPNVSSPTITFNNNTDGSVNIEIGWGYTNVDTPGAANNIDGFYVILNVGDTSAAPSWGTLSNKQLLQTPRYDARQASWRSMPADKYYSVNIIAVREVDQDVAPYGKVFSGQQVAGILLPAGSPNYLGSIGGIANNTVLLGVTSANNGLESTGVVRTNMVGVNAIQVDAITTSALANTGFTAQITSADGWFNVSNTPAFTVTDSTVQVEVEFHWQFFKINPTNLDIYQMEWKVVSSTTPGGTQTDQTLVFQESMVWEAPTFTNGVQQQMDRAKSGARFQLTGQSTGTRYYYLMCRCISSAVTLEFSPRRRYIKANNMRRIN